METPETVETKYGKYIITKTLSELNIPESPNNASVLEYKDSISMISLGDMVIKGSFLLRNRLFLAATEKPHLPEPHVHDTDEALCFFGTNPDNWKELGGEIELWIEDEKHIITESCVVYIPKGIRHCPLWVKKVYRPIFHYAALPSVSYALGQ